MGTPISPSSLAIDMGNSGAKAAVFRGNELIGPVIRFNYQEWESADKLATNHDVKNIVYSSVANVPPQEMIDKWTNEHRRIIGLPTRSPLPFSSWYATPETLGQDRIAAVMGVLASPNFLAPASALKTLTSPDKRRSQIKGGNADRSRGASLIVDAGTCVTMDLMDEQGVHRGGNISPGLKMRLRAMHEFTARLPLFAPGDVSGEVGNSTESALLHGAQLGLVYELEGLYSRLAVHHSPLTIILTGGDGEWLSGNLSVPCSFRPNLVLHGLIQLMSHYVRNES